MTASPSRLDLAVAAPVLLQGLAQGLGERGIRVETAATSWVEFSRSWGFSAGHVLVDAYLDDHVPLVLKVRALRREQTRVAVLGRHPDSAQARRALREGAELWLSPELGLDDVCDRLAGWADDDARPAVDAGADHTHLTDRELQVLCLYASRRGHPVAEVGKVLGISAETARTHLRTGRAKLAADGHDAGTRTSLERALVSEGLLEDVETWREMRRW